MALTLADAAAWATIIALLAGVVIFLVQQAQRRRDRGRAADETGSTALDEATDPATRERTLERTEVEFRAFAWPPFGGDARPDKVPLLLAADGDPVWVQEVRVRVGTPSDGVDRSSPGRTCAPWDGRSMPAHLKGRNDGLLLDWPGLRPPEPRSISWELEVDWSAERRGPTETTTVPGGDTDWQKVGEV
jgi:hypothetical protein